MAPDWPNFPPRAGPSDSGTRAAPNPRDGLDQAENAGEDGRDKPQFEWVYNSDHTDRENFGYMFLKPVGTRPTRANAGSSHITVRAPDPSTLPSPLDNRSHPIPSNSVINEGYGQPSQSSGHTYGYPRPAGAGDPSGQLDPGTQLPYTQVPYAPQPHYPVSDASSKTSTHHQIPYRSSPNHGISAYPPPEQLTPPESLQWEPQHGTPISQDFGQFPAHQQKSLRDSSEYPSQGFVSPVSSATPILTPEAFVHPSLPQSKGKRKLSHSPVLSQAENPLGDIIDYQTDLRKRRIQLNDVQQLQVWTSKLSICKKCKQYLIPRSDPGVCASCQYFSNIHIWPSISASRLESLESLVLFLMPAHMEECLLVGADSIPRGRSWRPLAYKIPHSGSDLSTLLFQDQWTLSKQQTRSIGLYGSDYEELADICQTFQRSQPIRNISLEAACTTLISVCDFYKCVIAPPNKTGIPSTTPITEVVSHIRTVRITLLNAFQQLQYLALSPSTSRSRQDWLPVFLSANILIMTAVIFLDILGQFPSPYREQIWGPNWHDRLVEMRHGGYGIMLNHLRANTNGVNPLKMDCWTETPPAKAKEPKSQSSSPFIISTPKSYTKPETPKLQDKGKGIVPIPPTRRKDKINVTSSYFWDTPGAAQPDQDILLGNQSPAALQGLISLKAWQKRYGEHLEQGKDMFDKEMYAVAMIRPVAYLSKIFDLDVN